jgi:hypothetical protein
MIIRAMRLVGALAILAVGAVHLQQYLGADYRAIPTIGPLFLLNAIASGVVGIALLFPIERVFAGRKAPTAVAALATGAVAIAVGSLIALFISESGSLFGFSEPGYRTAVVIAIVIEAATVVLLAPVACASFARARSTRPDVWKRQAPSAESSRLRPGRAA